MQTIIIKIVYVYLSPLKFKKIQCKKEDKLQLNEDGNQTKARLLTLKDKHSSHLQVKLLQYFEVEKKMSVLVCVVLPVFQYRSILFLKTPKTTVCFNISMEQSLWYKIYPYY